MHLHSSTTQLTSSVMSPFLLRDHNSLSFSHFSLYSKSSCCVIIIGFLIRDSLFIRIPSICTESASGCNTRCIKIVKCMNECWAMPCGLLAYNSRNVRGKQTMWKEDYVCVWWSKSFFWWLVTSQCTRVFHLFFQNFHAWLLYFCKMFFVVVHGILACFSVWVHLRLDHSALQFMGVDGNT